MNDKDISSIVQNVFLYLFTHTCIQHNMSDDVHSV